MCDIMQELAVCNADCYKMHSTGHITHRLFCHVTADCCIHGNFQEVSIKYVYTQTEGPTIQAGVVVSQ